jgi:integrase/recombinase XerD
MRKDVGTFLEYLADNKGCSQNTLAAYSNDLNQLMTFVETNKGKGVLESNDEMLKDYLFNLRDRKYSSATVARKIASAKSFFKFMVDVGKSKNNPTQGLLSPRVKRRSPSVLSPSEFRRLLTESAKLSTPEAKRDKVMLELLYATGLRVSELISLDTRDINSGQCYLYCSHGNSKRRVPFDSYIAKLLRDFIDGARFELLYDEREKALFLNRLGKRLTRQGFWEIVKNYASKAGLGGKVTPRTLRHSFAAYKLQTGAELRDVQQLLGHVYISSTKVYEQISPTLR